MVQSNKKLKQKLRAAKAELLASSEVKQEEGSMNEKTKQKQKKRKRDETDGLDKDKGELGKPMKKKKKKKNKGKKKSRRWTSCGGYECWGWRKWTGSISSPH